MIVNFVKRWFLGLGLEIPLVVVGSLAASIFYFMAKEVSLGASVILGFVGSGILCKFIDIKYEDDNDGICDKIRWGTETKGIKFWKVFLCLLPELAVSALAMALLVLFFNRWFFIALNVLGFTFAYWLTYWIYLLYHYGKYTCRRCQSVFSMEYVKGLESHSGEGTYTRTHSGSGIIGGVYDSDGNRVGDVKGDTSYTTSRQYRWYSNKSLVQCRYCGRQKEETKSHSYFIN